MVENKYLVNNKSLSQYFVIYPLLAMTEVKRSSQGFHTLLLVLQASHLFKWENLHNWLLVKLRRPKVITFPFFNVKMIIA